MRFVIFLLFLTSNLFAQDFISLVKNTESIYSQVMDIDASNEGKLGFETLLSDQKVYLTLSATKLNSSFISLINSDSTSKKMNNRELIIRNLDVVIDEGSTPSVSCGGTGLDQNDTNCANKNCTIRQRIVSQCNDDQCWDSNSSEPRKLLDPISENFSLRSKVDISDCVPNNFSGQKHMASVTVQNTSSTVLNGGTVALSIFLKNDSFQRVKGLGVK